MTGRRAFRTGLLADLLAAAEAVSHGQRVGQRGAQLGESERSAHATDTA